MPTTLPLISILKTDSRRDGAISFAQVQVTLDGYPTGANFKARVGEEPIVIDGDTITVSDAQVEQLRQARGFHAQQVASQDARLERELAELMAKVDAALERKGASAEAAGEIRAYVRANAPIATEERWSAAKDRYDAGYRALLARHGLLAPAPAAAPAPVIHPADAAPVSASVEVAPAVVEVAPIHRVTDDMETGEYVRHDDEAPIGWGLLIADAVRRELFPQWDWAAAIEQVIRRGDLLPGVEADAVLELSFGYPADGDGSTCCTRTMLTAGQAGRVARAILRWRGDGAAERADWARTRDARLLAAYD